jgi:serine/threonine kinase 16
LPLFRFRGGDINHEIGSGRRRIGQQQQQQPQPQQVGRRRQFHAIAMRTATSFLHTILHYVRAGWSFILALILRRRNRRNSDDDTNGMLTSLFTGQRQIINFDDSGIQVVIGNQIAQGGFSYIFQAYAINSNDNNDVGNGHRTKYALKRINCANNHELIRACESEANVHRVLFQSLSASSSSSSSSSKRATNNHPNLLELVGLKFVNGECCYMLFPYFPNSLRGEITKRNILNETSGQRTPFSTREVLRIFGGLIDALIAFHDANLSHRDVKIENVLLKMSNSRLGYREDNIHHYTPVLMDYGSAGPLRVAVQATANNSSLQQQQQQQQRASASLSTIATTAKIVEDASIFTTMSYRPPELFEGGLNTMKQSTSSADNVLDYGKVDVW